MATERGTSDKTEATRFSQCEHDQRRKLEAEDCDSIRCAQLISGGRRRIRPPYCLAHARPTMCCIHLVPSYNWASVIEPHTCDFNATFSIIIYATITVFLTLRSIFRYFLYAARAHIAPTRAARSGRPHPLSKPLPTGAEL